MIEFIINTEQAARLLGISSQRLRELTRAGKVPKHGHGRYDAWKLVPAYTESLREVAAGRASNSADGEKLDLVQERALLAKAQREKLEREAAQADRELIAAAEVKSAWFKRCRTARDRLMSLPGSLAPVLAHSDPGRAYELLEEEMRRTLEALAAEPTTGEKEPAHHEEKTK